MVKGRSFCHLLAGTEGSEGKALERFVEGVAFDRLCRACCALTSAINSAVRNSTFSCKWGGKGCYHFFKSFGHGRLFHSSAEIGCATSFTPRAEQTLATVSKRGWALGRSAL